MICMFIQFNSTCTIRNLVEWVSMFEKLVGWWLKILVNIYFVLSFFFYRVTHQMSELRQNIDKSWGEGHWF
jgi:hypothetical protein